jgi:hypothetical protein
MMRPGTTSIRASDSDDQSVRALSHLDSGKKGANRTIPTRLTFLHSPLHMIMYQPQQWSDKDHSTFENIHCAGTRAGIMCLGHKQGQVSNQGRGRVSNQTLGNYDFQKEGVVLLLAAA